MHLHYLDPYRPRSSPVHALDPRVKLVLVIAFILTASLAPTGAWAAYILLFAISLSVILLSDLGMLTVLRRSALALPFVLAAVPLVFTVPGPAIASIGGLSISGPGLTRLASIAIKSWLSVQMAIVLAMSTSFPDLLLAMRGIHLPRMFVSIFGLMWRYLFVLADEVQRMLRARAARSGVGAEPRGRRVGGTLAWRAKVAGGMAGSLFLRALERGDRIYLAMASRGYDGEVRSFPLPAIPGAQRAVLGAGLAALAVLLALSLVLQRA